jgi:O-antigen ligase
MIILAQFVISLSIYTEFINSGFSFFLTNGILARFSGFYDNPNIVGLVIVITSCIILGLFFHDNFTSRPKKILLSILLLNNLIITILTDSRAAIIALIFCGGFILFFFNKKLLILSILGTFIIVFLLMLIPSVYELINVLLRLESKTMRPYLWDAGYQLFCNNWLTGVGPENYKYFSFTYLPSSLMDYLAEAGHLSVGKTPSPHNFILLMASENGILGAVSVLSLYILYFFLNVKTMIFFKIRNKNLYFLMITFFAAGIGIFWRSLFEVSGIMNYGYMATDLPFWILMIVMTYLFHNKEKISDRNNDRNIAFNK